MFMPFSSGKSVVSSSLSLKNVHCHWYGHMYQERSVIQDFIPGALQKAVTCIPGG
jgi:hypothetical protein